MPMNKPHLEFHKVDMASGWVTPPGYPSGIQQKILASDLDETRKMGSRTRLLRFEPGVYTTAPFVHDHWEEVYPRFRRSHRRQRRQGQGRRVLRRPDLCVPAAGRLSRPVQVGPRLRALRNPLLRREQEVRLVIVRAGGRSSNHWPEGQVPLNTNSECLLDAPPPRSMTARKRPKKICPLPIKQSPPCGPYLAATAEFASGKHTPRQFLEDSLALLEQWEPRIGAFVCTNLPAARAAAERSTERWRAGKPASPIDGMPVGIKDIIETVDMPTEMGSALFAGWRSEKDAACVRALRDAGAVIIGKTVTTEFAASEPRGTRNPWDTARTPGGSSSGSAASVAAGIASAALGTQVISSTVRPASYCGCCRLQAER